MKLYATTTSERGKETGRGANDFIETKYTVNRIPVGEVVLDYIHDLDKGADVDEWVLKFRHGEGYDWDILAQGNI